MTTPHSGGVDRRRRSVEAGPSDTAPRNARHRPKAVGGEPSDTPADTTPIGFLFLYDAVYPETVGGVEHRNHRLAAALAARGHRVVLAGWASEPARPEPGVEIRPIGTPRPLHGARGKRSRLGALRLAWQALRLDLDRIDVVETANIPYLHVFALTRRCRRAGVPLIVTWHEYWDRHWRDYTSRGPFRLGLWRLYRRLERRAAHLGDQAVAVSAMSAQRVEAERRAPVPVITNGVDFDEMQQPATPDAGATDETAAPLVFVGRLIPDKRVDILVEAASLLAERVTGPILTIVGDGSEAQRLRDQIHRLGLEERVLLIERLETSAEVWSRMRAARVAVVPSAREGFGMFALEALAAGLPVVHCASPESAVGEIVRDGIEGFEVPADPESIARAVQRLLDDPQLHTSLAANAAARARSFPWSDVAAQLEQVARDLMTSREE